MTKTSLTNGHIKMQNYGDSKKISGCWSGEGRER